jgi:spermidine synthase
MAKIGGIILLANAVSFLVIPIEAFLATTAIGWWPSFLVVMLGAGLMGATLPLIAHFAIPPDDKSGARLSYLYLANIIGSALGSLATGFLLLDLVTIQVCGQILLGLGTLLGVILRRRLVAATIVTAALVLLAPWLHNELWERLMFRQEWDSGKPFEHVLENRHGVICVTADGTVYGGGMYDGKINTDLTTDRNSVYRPWSLLGADREYRRVLVVGLSMGSWAQVIAHFPGLKKLTIVEINAGYLDLIPLFPEVAGLLDDDRVEIVVDDGRRWLNRHPDARFDAIVQNTTYHWRAHMTNLLSREYMELCRSRLNDDGVMLFNTTGSEDAMLTALTVFPQGMRVFNNMMVSNAPLRFSKQRWRGRLLAVRLHGDPMFDEGIPAHKEKLEELMKLADELQGPPSQFGFESGAKLLSRLKTSGAAVITDDNMLSEWY